MFGLQLNGTMPANGPELHGTRDNHVYKGVKNTQGWLGAMFAGRAHEAEDLAYNRLHTGAEGDFGKQKLTLHGQRVFKHPDTGILLETGPNGEVTMLDGEVLRDRAALLNQQKEYCKQMFAHFFTSDEILLHCTSPEFVDACKANGNHPGMPAELVPACCLPSYMNFLPENSELFGRAIAKSAWLCQHHPGTKGKFITGGLPNTHEKAQRSGKTALADAVA